MNQRKLPIAYYIQYTIIAVAGTALTIYIFLSSFELLFNTPIPFISSVGYFESPKTLDSMVMHKIIATTNSDFSILPQGQQFNEMDIPRIGTRTTFIPSIKNNNQWVYRANSGQYFFLLKDSKSQPEFIVAYLDKNWRSLPNITQIEIGDNIFLKRDDGSTVLFRLTDKQAINLNGIYLPSTADQTVLVLVMQDRANHIVYVDSAQEVPATSSTSQL